MCMVFDSDKPSLPFIPIEDILLVLPNTLIIPNIMIHMSGRGHEEVIIILIVVIVMVIVAMMIEIIVVIIIIMKIGR